MTSYISKAVLLARMLPLLTPRPRSLAVLYTRLRALLDRLPNIRFLTVLKYIAYILVLLNAKSFPLVWHVRVFRRPNTYYIKYFLLYLRLLFISRKKRKDILSAYGEDLCPVGAHPFETGTVFKQWAVFDDIDTFGFHMSNSSYAKAMDLARANMAMDAFPAWHRSGGHSGLSATHYHFIREISPFASYEIRLTMAAWDHKWLYVIARFVTPPGRRKARAISPQSTSTPSTPNDASTPAHNGSADVEQAVAAIINANGNGNGNGHVRRTPIFEADGAILHCVAVSHMCFKMNRITVPPAVVIASEGFTKPYGDGDSNDVNADVRPYSFKNPPPNWFKAQSIRVGPSGGIANYCAFMRGKWREVPEGERWWEDALGGSIEAKRRANLELLDSLKLNLERISKLGTDVCQ